MGIGFSVDDELTFAVGLKSYNLLALHSERHFTVALKFVAAAALRVIQRRKARVGICFKADVHADRAVVGNDVVVSQGFIGNSACNARLIHALPAYVIDLLEGFHLVDKTLGQIFLVGGGGYGAIIRKQSFIILSGHACGRVRINRIHPRAHCRVHSEQRAHHNHKRERGHRQRADSAVLYGLCKHDMDDCNQKPDAESNPQSVKRRSRKNLIYIVKEAQLVT